jgi:hypothetical protein
MIAKLNNGAISYAPKKYTFTNPDPEMMKQYAGYKDFVENDKPVFDPETQILEPVYSETETQIVCDWRVKEIEVEAVTDGA